MASEIKDNKTQLIVDGGFYENDKAKEALLKGIELILGELVGRKPSNDKLSYSRFTVNDENNSVVKCAYSIAPVESCYSSNSYTAKFSKDECSKCAHYKKYSIKKQRKYNTVRFSEKRYRTDLQREKMQTTEYIKLTNQRAGIEGIPSVLRRRYKIDTLPVRGLLCSKLRVGFKISAYNVKKLLKQLLTKGYSPCLKLFSLIINIFCNSLCCFYYKRDLKYAS